MTSKIIDWTKFDELIEASKQTVADLKKIEEIKAKKKELYEETQKLEEERKKISEKYHQSYTDKLNDGLDDYGILTIITSSEKYEGHIISATKETMKIRYYSNYGSCKNEFEISIQELKEKGFVKHEAINEYDRVCYIVDDITNPLYVFEIIKFLLNKEVKELERELKWGKEEVEKGNKRIKESTEKLKEFEKVSDSKITRTFNDISFGVTNLSINDILKSLPREIKLYESEANEG